MKSSRHYLAMVLLLCGGCAGSSDGNSSSSQAPAVVFTLTQADTPIDNPLKGFMPYDGLYAGNRNFPHSLEFFYVPLKDLQLDFEDFNWDPLETKLAAIAGRGHQAVFRVYLDYPKKPYGMPDFLDPLVAKNSYTDHGNTTSYCPDYTDEDLQEALLSFIRALGDRYDSDPRVGYITVGLLGFWGEWHTYPHDEWMAGTTFMTAVLDAYQNAFPNKLLLAREPKPGVNMDRPRLGFHDDSFAYSTLENEDWYFWPKMIEAGLQDSWRTRPIGGEVRPEVQGCIWDDANTSCVPAGQEYDVCVETTHATWMLNQGAFAGLTGSELDNALAGARRLGYELYVPEATLQSVSEGSALQVSLKIRNVGVAPFYYPWTVKLAALDANGQLVTWDTSWDLRTVVDSEQNWTHTVQDHGLAAGTYTLLLGVPNPMEGGKPLRFANGTQDQDREGWLSLGGFSVK